MTLNNGRIEALGKWGETIRNKDWSNFYHRIYQTNPWFNKDNIDLALSGLSNYLDIKKLTHWSGNYRYGTGNPKVVGVIMAGNLPLVGIHDLICCYLSGHQVHIKLSSEDNLLMPALWSELLNLDPEAQDQVKFVSKLPLKGIDAIIATGSDNTSRYFRFNYQNIPCIIRGNRSSIAIIRGTETDKQLHNLGNDIYSYFGRGCRNVSKLLVPQGYQFERLISCQENFRNLLKNMKYSDNYRYQKALNSIRANNHFDTGFSLFSENRSLVSPLSVIYYEYYQRQDQLTELLSHSRHKIQCIASSDGWFERSLAFGSLQYPDLWDYADNIDTMEFLLEL